MTEEVTRLLTFVKITRFTQNSSPIYNLKQQSYVISKRMEDLIAELFIQEAQEVMDQ